MLIASPVEQQETCLFLTLFPAHLSVQFTIILTCFERMGWYPARLLVHPERYECCTHTTLYVPLPQDRVEDILHAQEQGQPVPPLDDLLVVTLHPDPEQTLLWYQVQCCK